MSYQPFISGPGRVGDVVKLGTGNFKVTHIDDVFVPRIGWNAANNTWQDTVFNGLAPHGDTNFVDLVFTNVAELRLFQLTAIEVNNIDAVVSIRQPANIIRWGVGNEGQGQLDGFLSPWGGPARLRELFSIQEKAIQMRVQNRSLFRTIVPRFYFRGYIYELEAAPAGGVAYVATLGGVE